MLKDLIILPDGTEISSGVGQVPNIRSAKVTECVNSAEELTMGSACAAMLETTIQTPQAGPPLAAGDEVTLYKVDDNGTRHKVGLFALERPTRSSANLMKLTGYDRVSKLDKDLTAWLKELDGWPYDLLTFARMVCEACGLTLATNSIPNADYQVQQFSKEATGRQLMRWIGEICCRFCRADADGNIELAWYTPAGVSITPSGASYYFDRSLVYEDYRVAHVDEVQVKLTSGAVVPTVGDGANSYVISGNPIFAAITADVLDVIRAELNAVSYTPCKVSIPATMAIRAGHTVQITDTNGVTITALVMTKTVKGQKDTLECTGSPRRDSTSARNNKTDQEKAADAETNAYNAGREAVKNQSSEDVFNALTNNGEIQGFYQKDGKLYINAEFVQILNLIVEKLRSIDGDFVLDIDAANIKLANGRGETFAVRNDEDQTYMYFRAFDKDGNDMGRSQFGANRMQIGGTWASPTLCFSTSLDGKAGLKVPGTDGFKVLSWKDNGDGTFTLIGT